MERDGKTVDWWTSRNTHEIYRLNSPFIWMWFMVPQNNYKNNIKDHQSQIIVANTIITENLNIAIITRMGHRDMR